MKAIESFKESRRRLFDEYTAQVEESLFVEPRVSERAKAQTGGLVTTAGGILFVAGIALRNEAVITAGLVVGTGGITAVSVVGNRADVARRVIRNRNTEQDDPRI